MELAGAAAAMVIGRIGTTAVRFYYLLNGDLINTRHLARRSSLQANASRISLFPPWQPSLSAR